MLLCGEGESEEKGGERREGREEGVFLAMKVCGEYSFSEVVFYRNIESLTLFCAFPFVKGSLFIPFGEVPRCKRERGCHWL